MLTLCVLTATITLHALPPTEPQPPVVLQVVAATGHGRAPAHIRNPQARLMARRAAEVVALRNLAHELKLPPTTALRGHRTVSVTDQPDGSAIVTLEWRSSSR